MGDVAVSAPLDTWIVAGTSSLQPYPCRCEGGRRACSPLWCPCAGRLDVWNFAPACCAWMHTPAVAAAAQRAYEAQRTRTARAAGWT